MLGYDLETLEAASFQIGGLLVCIGTIAFFSGKWIEKRANEKEEKVEKED